MVKILLASISLSASLFSATIVQTGGGNDETFYSYIRLFQHDSYRLTNVEVMVDLSYGTAAFASVPVSNVQVVDPPAVLRVNVAGGIDTLGGGPGYTPGGMGRFFAPPVECTFSVTQPGDTWFFCPGEASFTYSADPAAFTADILLDPEDARTIPVYFFRGLLPTAVCESGSPDVPCMGDVMFEGRGFLSVRYTVTYTFTPEPASGALILAGLAMLAFLARRAAQ